MDLHEYRKMQKTTFSRLCKQIGCCRNHLNLIANKKVKPGKSLIRLIEIVTNGEVTAKELLKDYKDKKNN